MLQREAACLTGLVDLQIPDVRPSDLITQSYGPLPKVHGESYEPYVALLEFETMEHRGACFTVPQLSVLETSRFPADYAVLARLAENKIAVPLDAVDVVAMNVARREVRKVLENRVEGPSVAGGIAEVRLSYRLSHVRLVEGPQFQSVIHAAGYYTRAGHVEVRAEYLVPVTLDTAEYRYTHVRLYVPQTERVIL